MRVYAMILPQRLGREIGRIFRRVGGFMAEFLPELKSDIVLAAIDMTAEEYMVASVVSSLLLGALLFTFAYVPLTVLELAPGSELMLSAIPAVAVMLLDFFVLIRYPRILAVKRAELVDRDLIYALKDLLLNISAGLTLYESIGRVSDADYGYVSGDLRTVVEETNQGKPLDDALEGLALRTSSEYMRNALWQTVNAVKAGTSVKEALSGIIESLMREQKRKIRNYIQELNVLSMIYMLFAVAVPTIITTVLVVLNSLMGTNVTESIYIFVIGICITVQAILVGFIKSRRPMVYIS
jgi:pilus assembly protein TadC